MYLRAASKIIALPVGELIPEELQSRILNFGTAASQFCDPCRSRARSPALESVLSGILLYPAAYYVSVQVLLIDQQSARSERFEGAIPPAPWQ